jgi:hypothetical protein
VIDIPKLLNGSPIASVSEILDYVQIRFINGAVLNVFSRLSINVAETIDVLVGSVVVSVSSSPDSLKFVCSSGESFGIGLRDCDLTGPEAAMLSLASGQQIVW